MSVRNMLKVMMSLLTTSLLAVTLAATIAHAGRLDQSLASKVNLPNPNSAAEVVLQVKGKTEHSGLIPYPECMKTCDKCACTKMWPPEINMCSCLVDRVPKKAAAAAAALAVQRVSPVKSEVRRSARFNAFVQVKGELFPFAECEEKCNVHCACILIWPPPEFCYCGDPIKSSTSTADDRVPNKAAAAAARAVQRVPQPELFPYAECNEKCKVQCACVAIWPPPKYCTCGDPIISSTHTVEQMQVKGHGKSSDEEAIPYLECIKTCDNCACTRMWPPESNWCICITPKPQAAGGKALPM